jgi:hypothetical protein
MEHDVTVFFQCSYEGCTNQARMAVKTQRPSRERVWSRVDYDDRSAPRGGQRVCREHGIAMMHDLILTMTDEDAHMPETKW